MCHIHLINVSFVPYSLDDCLICAIFARQRTEKNARVPVGHEALGSSLRLEQRPADQGQKLDLTVCYNEMALTVLHKFAVTASTVLIGFDCLNWPLTVLYDTKECTGTGWS